MIPIKRAKLTSKIEIEDNTLVIQDFETKDEEIVSYFKEVKPENRESRLNSSLKVGVLALKTTATTEKVNYIEKEFNKLNTQFNKVLEDTKTDISKDIDEAFGEKGTVAEMIEKHFGENGVVVKELFNPMKEGSPIEELKKIIIDEIGKIGKKIDVKEAQEQIIQQTPQKGVKFEDLIENLLAELVQPHIR